MYTVKKQLTFNSRNYLKILSLLNNVNNSITRLIGGCVRDAVINRPNTDIDIATTLLPHQLIEIFTDNKIKFIATGIKFGTLTIIIENEKFEITTLRKDVSSNGRHPKVIYSNDFHEDAQRRDFTINALSYCPFKEELYDYFNGLSDLKEHKVIFIGDPSVRIAEDYLRILRFFRFSHIFADKMDLLGLEACIIQKKHLTNLSRERIKWEMDKILVSDNAEVALKSLYETGILAIIFPDSFVNINLFRQAAFFAAENNIKFKFQLKYVFIFFKITDLTINKLISLKFSKAEARLIFGIIIFIQDFSYKDVQYILKKTWLEEENYIDYILAAVSFNKLDSKTAQDFIMRYQNLLKPRFEINGNHLISLGFTDKMVGQVLNDLKEKWIISDFKLSKMQLLKSLVK